MDLYLTYQKWAEPEKRRVLVDVLCIVLAYFMLLLAWYFETGYLTTPLHRTICFLYSTSTLGIISTLLRRNSKMGDFLGKSSETEV